MRALVVLLLASSLAPAFGLGSAMNSAMNNVQSALQSVIPKATSCLTKKGNDCTGDCALLGSICTSKTIAQASNTAFSAGSNFLKGLGKNVQEAVTKITKDIAKDVSSISKLTPTDMKAVVAGIAGEAQKGKKIAQSAMKGMMDKMKNAPGWGSVSSWTGEKLAEVGKLAKGLSSSDLKSITQKAFTDSIQSLGSVTNWARSQSKELAKKFKESVTDFSSVAGSKLNEAKGFLNGIDATDLNKISANAFKTAQKAFQNVTDKIGAWSQDQGKAIAKQLKQSYGQVKDMAASKVKELGSLIGTLDASDLKEMSDAAIAVLDSKAIKAMGGSKARDAFTADKIKKMGRAARLAFNGATLKDLVDVDKIKAALDCQSDCPKAIADITIQHDASNTTNWETKIRDALTAAGEKFKRVTLVQDSAATVEESSETRRRLTSSSSGDSQSVVRIESDSEADANQAGSTATSETGGSSTVIGLEASNIGTGNDAARMSLGISAAATLVIAALSY